MSFFRHLCAGEPDRIRTCDLLIKSQLLYQLSYGPTRIGSGRCIDPPISGRLVSMHSEVNVSAPLSIRLCRKCFPFRRRNAGRRSGSETRLRPKP